MAEAALSDDGAELCLLAVPKKGRLYEKCNQLLAGIGLEYKRAPRQDIAICPSMPIKIVFLPAKDIAQFVGEGNVDIGLTGQDMVAEADVEVKELIHTGFGKCQLALQAPIKDNITDPKMIVGKRIATSFPNLTKQYFASLADGSADAKDTKVRSISGSVEAACGLGLADAVVDLVETGTTMRAAGLEIVSTIMRTETVVIANPHSTHEQIIETLRKRIEGYLLARKHKMIYYNVAKEKLEQAMTITPGKKKPTLTPLADDDWLSVGAMVATSDVNNIMDDLQALGASDIFVVDLNNCRA
ncbi:ATP phosphoribosyltransferase [Hondaea fermentalgiana]|uniref:ATP phosphoribosyltransferase n=1 Tax=Hondaea fermentalgiana TaxID=2315210 RepID=A0A2R5GK28_9STRA|nr:ATP phosphoribosyltransferase [Hondaea fermentalgiana]|eukprot:GBG30679.1 ATP phosphoribosyltransferase [Hondaea fermentalgiana]